MDSLFGDSEMIFSYSRKQALEDGVLVDVSRMAHEAGIRYPVAVTQGVFSILNDLAHEGQDFEGRTWDMLMIFKLCAKREAGDVIHFSPLFLIEGKKEAVPVKMWAQCGPGDEGEPVITVMLEGED